VYLTILSVIFTMILGFGNNVYLGLIFFAVANFGCQLAIVFYNAMMSCIAPKDKLGLVSGFGRMMGYSGAIVALYIVKPIVLKYGYRASFFPTGVSFLLFSLPCLLFVRDTDACLGRQPVNMKSFFAKERFFEAIRQTKEFISGGEVSLGLSDYLKSAFFSLSVVNAVILFMSVYATRVFHLNENQIVNLIMFSTLFAIIGSIGFGFISDRIGAGRSLKIIIVLWCICITSGSVVQEAGFYKIIGSLVGLGLGGVWVVFRALLVEVAPKEKVGIIFGVFNLIGYVSAVIGALAWGGLLLFLARFNELGYRISLFSLNIFLALAFIFLLRKQKTALGIKC